MKNKQESSFDGKAETLDLKQQKVQKLLEQLNRLKVRTEAGPLSAIIGDLPVLLQQEVVSSAERLRNELSAKGMDSSRAEEVVSAEAKERVKEIKTAYTDKRFNSINGSYFRLELLKTLDELVTSEPNLESVQNKAVLSFDVNGLKAVNDFNNDHQKGDYYLKEVYKVLAGGQTTKELRKQGIEVVVASNGGDEFAIILKAREGFISEEQQDNKGQQNNNLSKILADYQKEIGALTHYIDENTKERKPFIDFSDPAIRQKFTELGVEIPAGFEFHASISAGSATLMDAIFEYMKEVEAKPSEDSPKYHQILNGIMGQSFTISDERSVENKEAFKGNLKTSSDKAENFMGLVLSRNKEVIELTMENRKIREALETCESDLSKK